MSLRRGVKNIMNYVEPAELSKAIAAYCQDEKDYDYLGPSARVRNKAVNIKLRGRGIA